ncbi:MAG: GAF domain-containing protein [Candidatus Omnitrophica bacterium]|nr:GAF domain-containing protein [Candidatus Omnitrophota bacterium]
MPKGKRKKGAHDLHRVERTLRSRLDELTALYEVSKSITSAVNLDKMLSLIVSKVASIMKAEVCMIHLINKGDLRLRTSYGITARLAELKNPLPVDHTVVDQVIRTKMPVRVEDLQKHSKNIFFHVARKGRLHSLLIVPLIEKGELIGVLSVMSKRRAAYSISDEKELTLFASQAAVAIENARLFEEVRINYLNTMRLLACVIDAKDTYTEDHSERVMRSALAIADYLSLSAKQRSVIRYASLLHDIGKIGIDMSVLRKPTTLSKEEWRQMKQHPKIGADIIKRAGFLDDLVPAILYHHVKYSGGGYPITKKTKEDLPVEARVLAVADAYEAMVTDRPYRRRMTKDQAIAELKRCSGSQFDPKVVNALLRYLTNT